MSALCDDDRLQALRELRAALAVGVAKSHPLSLPDAAEALCTCPRAQAKQWRCPCVMGGGCPDETCGRFSACHAESVGRFGIDIGAKLQSNRPADCPTASVVEDRRAMGGNC